MIILTYILSQHGDSQFLLLRSTEPQSKDQWFREDRLKKENAELKSQKSQGDCRKVEEELQKSRKQIEGLTSEIEELKKKLTAPAGDVSGLQKQLKDLERSYVECRRNLNLLMIEDRKRNKDSVETSKVIVSNIEIVPKEGSNKQGFIVGATAN